MKKLLYTNLGWIALIMTPCISVFGQNRNCAETFMFTNFNGYCGSLLYKVCTEEMGCSESKNRVDIDFSGTGKFESLVEVKIYGFTVNEERCGNCEGSDLKEFARKGGVIKLSKDANFNQTGPLQFSELVIKELQYKRGEKKFSDPITIQFKAKKNGNGQLKIKYYIGQMTQEDYYSFSIPYEVTGLADPVRKNWETHNRDGLDGWCRYIRQQHEGDPYIEEAKGKIERAEKEAWNHVKNSTSASAFRDYIERFKNCGVLCLNCEKAKQKINEINTKPKPDDPAKRDKAAFDLALGHRKVELYQAYLKEYPNGISAQEAKDSIIRLTPIGRVSLPDEGGWIRIQFTNIVDPRVDIPEEGSLIIDTTRLDEFKSKGILSFKYGNKSGIIPLEVYDSAYFWKSLKIDDLNNMLEAKIIEWDSSAYELKMLVAKGVPPYRIEITDENGELVYSRTGIRETEFVIVRDSLLAKAKITGDYTVTVGDSDTNEQAIIAGTFRMEVKRKFTLVIIGAGVLLAAIIVIFLLIRRRGQKQRDMYDIR